MDESGLSIAEIAKNPDILIERSRVQKVGLEWSPQELNEQMQNYQSLLRKEGALSDHDKKHNLEPTESVIEQELGHGTVLCVKELRDIENNSNPTQDQITRKSILEERIRSSMIDYKYAIRYWMENPSKVTDGSYALMVKHLVKSAHNFGHLGLFANRGGLDEKDKMNVSAHRALARQLGYGVGAAKLDRQTGIISMPIRPLLSSKTT